jgi:hypothetical protein
MTIISSNVTGINRSAEYVYKYLINLEQFRESLPEQVTNYRVEGNKCSFTIQGMADLSLIISETIANEKVIFANANDKPFPFNLIFKINSIGENSSSVMVSFEGELNPMIIMVAKGPLQNFVNMVAMRLANL